MRHPHPDATTFAMKNAHAIHPAELVPFTSTASAILLFVLVCLQLGTGVTQQFFESVRDPAIYAQRLVESESWFRIIAGVDDVFLIFYSTSAVLLALSVRERSGGLWMLVLAGGLGAGLLDAAENHHMLAIL